MSLCFLLACSSSFIVPPFLRRLPFLIFIKKENLRLCGGYGHSLHPLPPGFFCYIVLESSIELLNGMSDLTDGGESASCRTAYRIFMLSCILSSRFSGFNTIFIRIYRFYARQMAVHASMRAACRAYRAKNPALRSCFETPVQLFQAFSCSGQLPLRAVTCSRISVSPRFILSRG